MSVTAKSHNACVDTSIPLGIDEACLSIVNNYNSFIRFYSTSRECYMCDGVLQATLPPMLNTSIVVSTKYPLHFYYSDKLEWCHTTHTFVEHGFYGWNISAESKCSDVYTLKDPPDPYLPILAAFLLYTLLAVTWATGKIIYRITKECWSRTSSTEDDGVLLVREAAIGTTRMSTRIRSVDTFRGIAILLMIFVNNDGGKYVFFNHSAWYGLTVADLVFPWFMWIMGLTITISKRAELRVSTSRGKIILRCLERSLLLIFLGLMVNSQKNQSLSDLRFPGVLQLLAITYFICATLETIFMKPPSEFRQCATFRDIFDNWRQWAIIIVITSIHTLITFMLPVPNCPRGYMGPGGYSERGKYINCTGGAAGYIDRRIFGTHMYNRTHNAVYGDILPHDPEGLMNTLSAVLIVYLGVHAGKILLLYYQYHLRAIRWFGWALITGLIAGALCGFEKYEGIIPVNKKMMSLSFVLTVSSFAFLVLCSLNYLVDYKKFWSGAPFIYAGINPIFLYFGHEITRGLFPWSWHINEPTHTSVLALNLWTTTCWLIIAYGLYRKNIIITV